MVEHNDRAESSGPIEFFHKNPLPKVNDLVEAEFLTDASLILVSPEVNGKETKVWLCNENGERHPKAFYLQNEILVLPVKSQSEFDFNPSEGNRNLYCFAFDLGRNSNDAILEYKDALTTRISRRNPYLYVEVNEGNITPLNPAELTKVLHEKSDLSFEEFLEIYEGKGSWGYKE